MGIAKGKAEGIIEGQRALLRRVAMLRFGNVPDQLEQRIADADQDALGQLAEHLATAVTLDDVLKLDKL